MKYSLNNKGFHFIVLLIALLVSAAALAQTDSVSWEKSPSLHVVQSVYKNEAAVVILDKRTHQYLPNDKDGLMVIVTNHRIIRVNNDKGVEQFNKIYLPISPDGVYREIRARVITSAGKVIELPQEKILEEEEEGRSYKKFALEGVEIGSEIEYITVQQKGLYFFGLEVFQYPAPCQLAEFSIATPDHLVFDVKGYNGFVVEKDSIANDTRTIKAKCMNIAVSENEKYAQPVAFLKNIQYKLSYNLSKEKGVRLFTWNQLAQNIFTTYSSMDEKEMKAVIGYIKVMKIEATSPEETRIVLLEDFLKNNVSMNEEGIGEDADKIEKIIKTGVASHDGLKKLFVACMYALHIDFQIVFPNKRNDIPIDTSLENYRLIDDMVFYFPSTGHFLEPTNIGFRYPYIQPHWAATTGLFIQTNSTANGVEISAAFKPIPIHPFDNSAHNIEVALQLNESMDSVLMHGKQIFTGYGASLYRPAFHFLPKDKIQDFTQDVMKSIFKSNTTANIKVHNTVMADGLSNKPLIFEGDISSAELIEVAGKKILLKIGDVIGPQEQMYQEKPRQYPISMEYPHILDRTIQFEIPVGYGIKNPEDLNINIVELEDGKTTMGFVSGYTIAGNTLSIKIHEYYKQPEYPLEKFAVFQKVINAAADFNKVVLVLEKK